jgi:hypothetical protein
MAAIETIHPDGHLSVRLDNNRQIEFDPNEHRHLDHGYAPRLFGASLPATPLSKPCQYVNYYE